MRRIYPAKSIQNVFNSAVGHLQRGALTIAELTERLNRKTDNQEWITTVLNRMMEMGALKSDFDFAHHYATYRLDNLEGETSIKRKLKLRGLSENTINAVFEQIHSERNIDHDAMLERRLVMRESFSTTSREKLTNQLIRLGYNTRQINQAISNHPAKDTLRTKNEIKAAKANVPATILKLVRKGHGAQKIMMDLGAKAFCRDILRQEIERLTESGEIDFYESCKDVLSKKNSKPESWEEKNKLRAYGQRRGFSGDEINYAIEQLSAQ